MAIGRSEDWDNPWDAMVLLRHHCRVWDLIRAPHLGQRPSVPHTKAGHMTAIDQNVISRCRPCETGAVHICVPACAGTTRTQGLGIHRVEEFGVALRFLELVDQKFETIDGAHRR